MSTWYYCRYGQQTGPVALDELKELIECGELNGTTQVWETGMSEWVKVRNLPELACLIAKAPPVSSSMQLRRYFKAFLETMLGFIPTRRKT